MKRTLLWILMLGLWNAPVWAAGGRTGDFGLGAVIGSPMGLSTKWWLSPITAFQMSLGEGDSELELTGDFLWHTDNVFPKPNKGRLPLYLGLGGRAQFEDDPEVGIRFVAGLEYLFADAPIGFFAEIVPVLDLAPDTDSDMSGGIGLRYYFGPR